MTALLLGAHDEHGKLHYVGNVGTGFIQATRAALLTKLQALHATSTPFADVGKGVIGRAYQCQ